MMKKAEEKWGVKTIRFALLSAAVFAGSNSLALAESTYSQSSSQYGAFELDRRQTIHDTDSGVSLESQTHVEYPVNDSGSTSLYGGSDSIDNVGTTEGDSSTYSGGIKHEF